MPVKTLRGYTLPFQFFRGFAVRAVSLTVRQDHVLTALLCGVEDGVKLLFEVSCPGLALDASTDVAIPKNRLMIFAVVISVVPVIRSREHRQR